MRAKSGDLPVDMDYFLSRKMTEGKYKKREASICYTFV